MSNQNDIYKQKATTIFNVSYDEVTTEQRDFAKRLTFGEMYSSGSPLSADMIESISTQTGVKWDIKDYANSLIHTEKYQQLFSMIRKRAELFKQMSELNDKINPLFSETVNDLVEAVDIDRFDKYQAHNFLNTKISNELKVNSTVELKTFFPYRIDDDELITFSFVKATDEDSAKRIYEVHHFSEDDHPSFIESVMNEIQFLDITDFGFINDDE